MEKMVKSMKKKTDHSDRYYTSGKYGTAMIAGNDINMKMFDFLIFSDFNESN